MPNNRKFKKWNAITNEKVTVFQRGNAGDSNGLIFYVGRKIGRCC